MEHTGILGLFTEDVVWLVLTWYNSTLVDMLVEVKDKE